MRWQSRWLFAWLVVWRLVGGHGLSTAAEKPNLVVLLCDDLGYGDLECYGHPRIKTPHLNELAKQGLRFTNCYAAAPVCSPSRAGLLTGRHPYRQGIRDWIPENSGIYLAASEPTIPKLLKSAGYATAHVGKWHLNGTLNGSEPTPREHGFDHWFSTQNNAAPSHHNPKNFVRNGQPVGALSGYSSEIIISEALTWLKAVPTEQPFCLFVWFHAPHEPVATPSEFVKPYGAVEDTKAIYEGSVAQVDHEVGRFLKALDERGASQNTLVFFTSDNGPETHNRYRGAQHSHGTPGPLRGMKLHLYEGGCRVPGILRWPARLKAGQVSDEPIGSVDLLPTICELAGVTRPENVEFDGASLVPVLDGQPMARMVPLYWQYDRAIGGPNRYSLRDGAWKILSNAKRDRFELYDLAQDPSEKVDLANREPERLAELRKALESRRAAIDLTPPTSPRK